MVVDGLGAVLKMFSRTQQGGPEARVGLGGRQAAMSK